MDVAGFARHGERDLAFEIEMILPAAAQFAGEAMRRGCERGVDVAASHRFAAATRKLSRAIASSIVSTAGSASYSTSTSFAAARA